MNKFIKYLLAILVVIIYIFVVSIIASGIGLSRFLHFLLLCFTFPLVKIAWHKIVHYGEDSSENDDQRSDESKE